MLMSMYEFVHGIGDWLFDIMHTKPTFPTGLLAAFFEFVFVLPLYTLLALLTGKL